MGIETVDHDQSSGSGNGDDIEARIFVIRGERVILDADLAAFYGVPTKRLNEQVKRNRQRFPPDFLFTLTQEEKQQVVANCDQLSRLKYAKSLPHALTEHGAIMAAAVVNSRRAIDMSVFVVRAFVNLRRQAALDRGWEQQIKHLEKRLVDHDHQLAAIIRALRRLAGQPDAGERRRIGFETDVEQGKGDGDGRVSGGGAGAGGAGLASG